MNTHKYQYGINKQDALDRGFNKYLGESCVKCGSRVRYVSHDHCKNCQRERNSGSTTTMLMIDRYNFEKEIAQDLKEVWE